MKLDEKVGLCALMIVLLVVLMAGTGFATALAAGLPEIVFAGSGAPLPKSFAAYPTFQAHFWFATLLVDFRCGAH